MAQHQAHALSADVKAYKLQFFTVQENDLLDRVAQSKFREDLYYRLNVVPLHMPALRQRRGDIAPLAIHFVEKVCRAEGIPVKEITSEALAAYNKAYPVK